MVRRSLRLTEEDRYRQVGEGFHEQLETLLTEDNHPDDPEHNVAVGKALVTAIERGAVEEAEHGYNQWAGPAGYAPVRVLSTRIGESGQEIVVDIASAIIAIDTNYRIVMVEEQA